MFINVLLPLELWELEIENKFRVRLDFILHYSNPRLGNLTEIKPIAKERTSNQSPENHRCLVQLRPLLKSDLRKVVPFTPFRVYRLQVFVPYIFVIILFSFLKLLEGKEKL